MFNGLEIRIIIQLILFIAHLITSEQQQTAVLCESFVQLVLSSEKVWELM